jgi:hypothetical protein
MWVSLLNFTQIYKEIQSCLLHKILIKEIVKLIILNTKYLKLCPQQIVEVGKKTETKPKHSSLFSICTWQMAERHVHKGLPNS